MSSMSQLCKQQSLCSQCYVLFTHLFLSVEVPSFGLMFQLGYADWLALGLLVDLSVVPGRQSSLNCCMSLERASLIGLLEFQSVSAAFSLSNLPASTSRASQMMQQKQPQWQCYQEAMAWRNIFFMHLSDCLVSNWAPAVVMISW